MLRNKPNYIWEETNNLHDKLTELYESLMESQDDDSVKIIDDIRASLLTIRKDLIK